MSRSRSGGRRVWGNEERASPVFIATVATWRYRASTKRSFMWEKSLTLWTTNPDEETEINVSTMGIRAWRWRFFLDVWSYGIALRLQQEVSSHREQIPPEHYTWHRAPSYFIVRCMRPEKRFWVWGEDHEWYDGYNCTRSFGLLAFNWGYWHCDKCLPPGNDDFCSL